MSLQELAGLLGLGPGRPERVTVELTEGGGRVYATYAYGEVGEEADGVRDGRMYVRISADRLERVHVHVFNALARLAKREPDGRDVKAACEDLQAALNEVGL